VARASGLAHEEVVAVHSAVEYVVGFMGFSPGFAYLLGLDERIAVPRNPTPRPRVAAGSIGIGDAYTGVYPRATAGGWRLIGRTDVELFDPGRDPPALLQPGDRVRFVPR
jgi:KipI family sensor histidine kinase inhibitor